MATLEKIRSKSALLVIVIGVALLAFIIGDAITNSRNLFGDRTTIAKVDGVKIDYADFARKREELQQQMQNNPNVDPQILSQLALENLINEALLDKAVNEADIQVSGEQLRQYLLEAGMQVPEMQQLIRTMNGNGMNVATPQQAYDFIFNPKAHGLTNAQMQSYQQYWMNMENEAKVNLARQIYGSLLFGTITANDLDKKFLFEDESNARHIEYAYKMFGQIDDKKYPVTDAEIKAEYDRVKPQYRLDEQMKRGYLIAVAVNPSEADMAACKELAREAVQILKQDTAAAAKTLQKKGVSVTPYKVLAKQIPSEFRSYVTSAPKDSISIVYNNVRGFAAVKMGSKTMAVDSLQINVVQVSPSLVAQVKAALNGGLAIDSINTKFSADSVGFTKDMWIAQYSSQNALPEAQLDSLLAAGSRYITLQEVPGAGAVIAQVQQVRPRVEIYNFEAATYNLVPSSATLTDAVTKLEKFLADNPTAEQFKNEAGKAGYQALPYNFTPSMPAVPLQPNAERYAPIPLQQYGPLYDGSAQVVGWVVRDGKPGKVSPMFENQNTQQPMLYAVAVEASFDDYVPMEILKEKLTADVRKQKVGADMVKQYQGKGDVNAIATAMGVTPNDIPSYTLQNGMGRIRDAKVAGEMAGSKVNGPVVVVAGENGVYAYKVLSQEASKVQAYDPATYAQKYRQSLGIDGSKLLRGDHKVKNNLYKFIELQQK